MLITGGAGFVGSHLCEKYVREGHTVVCLDNFMSGDINNVRHLIGRQNFKLIPGDVRDSGTVEKAMRGCEAVFHLAAQIHVDRSYIEPALTWDINVMGTQTVLEVARLYDVRKVIYASTSEVYGTAQYAPINERHPLRAPHPYGSSKIAADRMCWSYIQTYGMPIVIMRPFNIFGERQRSNGYGGVISIFTRRALNGVPPIIYGDGQQSRDYTYIDDTVRAYDLVLNYDAPINEPVNIGTGTEVTINYLASKIIELCGKSDTLAPVHESARIGEVKRLICDPAKAGELLGWTPRYSFDEGLARFVEWYRNHGFEETLKMDEVRVR